MISPAMTSTSSSSFLLLLLLVATATISATFALPSPRTLRALDQNGYQYASDLSGSQMQFGKCVRVKVPNNDDDNEGNSYFYNGHYYAQQQTFASVFVCDGSSSSSSSSSGSGGSSTCGVCDTNNEYVVDLATYLEISLNYAQAMCNTCNAQCANGYNNNKNNNNNNNRRLEQEDNGGNYAQMSVNCNTCVNLCANMNFANNNNNNNGNDDGNDDNNNNNNNNNNNSDETAYLECKEAFVDEDGIQLYAGPQCDSDGNIIIGFYYDNECSVKSNSNKYDLAFNYKTFGGIQQMCMDCSAAQDDGGNSVCDELYGDATHCSNGRNLNNNNNGGEDGDMPICKTYKEAHKEHHYASRRRSWKIAETLVALVLVGGFLWGFFTLSYTYYLRHRGASSTPSGKVPLAENDHQNEPAKDELPPVS